MSTSLCLLYLLIFFDQTIFCDLKDILRDIRVAHEKDITTANPAPDMTYDLEALVAEMKKGQAKRYHCTYTLNLSFLSL